MTGPDSGGCQGRESCEVQCCMDDRDKPDPDSGREARHHGGDEPCDCNWQPCVEHRTTATAVPDNAVLRARVQRVLGQRIGAPAIQLTADLFRPGEGLLAALMAERDEAVRQVAAVRALVAFYDRHEYATLNVDDLRAALDAD